MCVNDKTMIDRAAISLMGLYMFKVLSITAGLFDTCMHSHTHATHMHEYTDTLTHAHTYKHARTHAHTHAHMHVHTHIFTYTQACTYMHTNIHTHRKHTCTHIKRTFARPHTHRSIVRNLDTDQERWSR